MYTHILSVSIDEIFGQLQIINAMITANEQAEFEQTHQREHFSVTHCLNLFITTIYLPVGWSCHHQFRQCFQFWKPRHFLNSVLGVLEKNSERKNPRINNQRNEAIQISKRFFVVGKKRGKTNKLYNNWNEYECWTTYNWNSKRKRNNSNEYSLVTDWIKNISCSIVYTHFYIIQRVCVYCRSYFALIKNAIFIEMRVKEKWYTQKIEGISRWTNYIVAPI